MHIALKKLLQKPHGEGAMSKGHRGQLKEIPMAKVWII